jgi:hypothetical protein
VAYHAAYSGCFSGRAKPSPYAFRAAALKTLGMLAKMASEAGHFGQHTKKFWGAAGPQPPARGLNLMCIGHSLPGPLAPSKKKRGGCTAPAWHPYRDAMLSTYSDSALGLRDLDREQGDGQGPGVAAV